VSLGDHTVSFVGEGIDPGGEKDLSRQLHVEDGRNLSPDDPNGVILGVGLARNIGAVVGDRIVVLATTANGSVNATEVVIRGLFYTSAKAFDDTVLRMPIDAARQLLRTSGSHALVLLLDDTEHVPSVLANLAEQFPEDQTGLEFVPWYDLADYYNKTVRLFSRQMLVIELIVAVIVILTISNAAAMNILERTAEIGTLMALGLRRGKILRLFLYEGLALGVLGGAAGVALGWALSIGISAIGIPMPPSPGMDVAFDAEILVNGQIAANGFVMAVAAATVATIYPAWRASRLAIVDALRRGR
jgi:putative ABC transport system permease protein